MAITLTDPTYKRRQVVTSTGVPESTLNRWQERGFMRAASGGVGTGHHWLFSALDIARIAAIAELIANGCSVADAAKVIDGSITGASYWQAMIERREKHLFVCVRRREGDPIVSEIHCVASQVIAFLTEEADGELEGCETSLPLVHKCVFDVGPAVTRSLEALAR